MACAGVSTAISSSIRASSSENRIQRGDVDRADILDGKSAAVNLDFRRVR